MKYTDFCSILAQTYHDYKYFMLFTANIYEKE